MYQPKTYTFRTTWGNGPVTGAGRISWPAGKLHALRPVFRELGHCAAVVYEALEQSGGRPQRSFDLTGATGLSRRAVYQALETLAAWHLVQPGDGRWTLVAGTSLQLLAERTDQHTPPGYGSAAQSE